MKKYKRILTLLLLVLTIGLTINVQADVGPKPTSRVSIIGVEEEYTFDVLFDNYHYITYLSDEEIEDQISQHYSDDFPTILNGYKDPDGFVSYTLYRDMPHSLYVIEDDVYKLGYFSPPETFKAVIVTESGNMFISEVIDKTYFDAEFIWDLSDVDIANPESQITLDAGNIRENLPYFGGFLLTLLLSMVITILLELGLLFVFGYRQFKSYKLVLIINIITQIILLTGIYIANIFASIFGAIFVLLIGEIFVFIFEIIYYSKKLNEHKKGKAVGYGFLANLVSLILGTYILSLITNIL